MALLDTQVSPPTEARPQQTKEVGVTVIQTNPFAAQDYALIINTFEKNAAQNPREEYALVYHYKDVYSTRNFSQRVQEQMQYYPGMHQTGSVPQGDPAYKEASTMAAQRLNYWNTAMDNPDSFMNALRDNEKDFDYTTIFGTDADAKTRAENIGKMITQCIPCFDRKLDLGSLLPDGNLLEIHALNIQMRTDLLDLLKDLLGPGMYIDICELLNLLSKMCPKDLLAMLILLGQYLAKLNLDISFNIDFIINLIGPILSPFLNALSAWLDKWVQMILGPILCVIDHINETIIIAQQAKIPFSEAGVNIDHSLGIAGPGHQNAFASSGAGAQNQNFTNGAAWSKGEAQRFETPDSEKYNPSPPDVPDEETYLAGLETAEGWKAPEDRISPEERAAVDQRWAELRAEQARKARNIPPPERYTPGNGTRWSKDNVPNSEKADYHFGDDYNPPERQQAVKDGNWYIDASPLVNSIVQMRNVLQGSVQYMQDWFNYINQMVYDLLGTDFGWMQNKAKSTRMKSEIIQLIAIIRALLEAGANNGLKCGQDTNFDESQMRYIFENSMKKQTGTEFKFRNDGTIEIIPYGSTTTPETSDPTRIETEAGSTTTVDLGPGIGEIETVKNESSKQKPVKSGIIIKNCLKDMTEEQLSQARKWIAQYESGMS